MHEKHPEFIAPQDENQKIWRFIDFTKFIDMLDKQSLYFCRVDFLGDTFEGTYSKATIEKHLQKAGNDSKKRANVLSNLIGSTKMMHEFNFVNCWHRNSHEPYDMWKTYTKGNESIAIQSSYKKLISSFEKTSHGVMIGTVKYIDYKEEEIAFGNLYKTLLHKRKNFEHEQELRAVILHIPEEARQSVEEPSKKTLILRDRIPSGINVETNLNELIEKIIVAPKAEIWFKELVESMLKKSNLEIPVESSELDSKPEFY